MDDPSGKPPDETAAGELSAPAETVFTEEAFAAEGAGGDPACWARLVCPECGSVTSEGHNPGCAFSDSPDDAAPSDATR